MDRRLIDYLPQALHSVTEFVTITDAQQPEIEKAWEALEKVMDNQFIDTATVEGVSIWEKELNIVPLDSETLSQRKQHIKTAWMYGALYTYNWLVQWLAGGRTEDIQLPAISDYVLRVPLPISTDYANVLKKMREYVAANIQIDPLLLLTKNRICHYVGLAIRTATRREYETTTWNTDTATVFTDEDGEWLINEKGEVLLEEVAI